jgi:asparagine synthase (glutamine-hydrolysing)
VEVFPHPGDLGLIIGLGVRRLAIQDLSPAGHQPMHEPATGNWLAFNGEIYNFRVLREELEKLGHRFLSTGDTEVLLAAYGEWGENCVAHLAGMFAFAAWDAQRQKLFLARDRLGVKPLYYFEAPNLFLFGSEVRSLLATGLVPRRPSQEGVASYLAFGAVQDPLTIVEGVHSLPAGHSLIWENGKLKLRRYWSLAEVAARPPATESPEEAVRAIRNRLTEAVSQRLISDVPLGIFLSGGVDSSSVVVLAREASEFLPDTFSVVFENSELSEADYSSRVARVFGCRHHEIKLTEEGLREEIPNALAAMDQPTMDGVNTYVVSKATKQAGITVALSGLGGDEVFAGYSSFVSVPRMMAFRRYAGWMEPLGAGLQGVLAGGRANRYTKLVALGGGQYPGNHPYFLSRALFLPPAVRSLSPYFAARNGHLSEACGLDMLAESVRSLDPVNQVTVLEGSTYMANMLLRDGDCMSMAHSLEIRFPLLDHRLWEYVLPLAGKLKLDPRLPKPLLLRAAGEKLPEEIYLRPKMGFTLPFAHWLRNGLGPAVEKELSGSRSLQPMPFDPAEARKVWRAFLAGKTTWSRPWALYVLKNWMQQNLGG